MAKIPFVNLQRMHEPLIDDFINVFRDITMKSAFIEGSYLQEFEKNFADFCNVKYCAGVSSGTDAIFLALKSLGIGKGDIVITVPNTFIATAEAIVMAGADVAFVDVDKRTYNMSAPLLEEFLEGLNGVERERVKAIIPVCLYGQAPDFDELIRVAEKYELKIVVDAAQAHGAEYKGKNVAEFGDAACFSFYPGKNLGAFGDAGAVVTNDEELYRKVILLRNHGRKEKYEHAVSGFNCRMDALQAAILNIKLAHLNDWNTNRIRIAEIYTENLKQVSGIIPPFVPDYNRHVFHLYVIQCENRSEIIRKLDEREISFGIHYPIPLHLQKAFSYLNISRGSYPVSETLSERILSLPIDGALSEEEALLIARTLI